MSARSSPRVSRVFVDSGAYYGLFDSRDDTHQEARAIAQRLASERMHLFTSNFVIAETYSLALNRLGRSLAVTFLRDIDAGSTTIISVEHADEQRAREIIYQYDDKDYSLVDAISFAIMERLSIDTAFAFDRHFQRYGFTLLRS